MKQPTRTEIAMVTSFEKLAPMDDYNRNAPEIRVIIAVKEGDMKTPRNWSYMDEHPKTSVGDCFASISASKYGEDIRTGNHFSSHGPNISHGDLNQYRHGVRAMERISKRLEAMSKARGYPADAAECMGRWLEACDISEVWTRPQAERQRWLTESDWDVLTIGQFVNQCRANLFAGNPKAIEQTEAA